MITSKGVWRRWRWSERVKHDRDSLPTLTFARNMNNSSSHFCRDDFWQASSFFFTSLRLSFGYHHHCHHHQSLRHPFLHLLHFISIRFLFLRFWLFNACKLLTLVEGWETLSQGLLRFFEKDSRNIYTFSHIHVSGKNLTEFSFIANRWQKKLLFSRFSALSKKERKKRTS